MAAPGAILAVGGAEDKAHKREILDRFVREAGGPGARIAILPTASSVPEEKAVFYTGVFAELGAGDCVHVPITSREDAAAVSCVEAIRRATGVFLTGGDQSRLVAALRETPALEAIHQGLIRGGALAGTSAGASAFSATMIVGGQEGLQVRRDAVRLAPGLGVINRLIIDQHFSQRDRLGRLLSAVAHEPERLGVGIDEDTAIVYYGNGEIDVIGSGQVFVLDGRGTTVRGLADDGRPHLTCSAVRLHVLSEGDRFDVVARRLLGQDEPVGATEHQGASELQGELSTRGD